MVDFKNAIVYEINVQSFYDSNNDGIGDIKGIIKKLNYLNKLGVNFLWLNPIYLSPGHDNGYDVSDYKKIDPKFGTINDFKKLIIEAKKKNIFIMMDMIFNHCSTEHIWFKKAISGDKEYQDRFFFLKNDTQPTNWKSKFGGSAWEYNEDLSLWYLHLFDKHQADLNWQNDKLRSDIYQVIEFWINLGVKGLRFDVINLIGKPNEFKNDNQSFGKHFYTDHPLVTTYLKELVKKTKLNENNVITVGELSSTTIKKAIEYSKKENNMLNMVFNFHHLKIDYLNGEKWKLKKYKPSLLINVLKKWQKKIQNSNGWLALFLNNHDQPRAISRFGDIKNFYYESAIALVSLVFLLRGTPFIYQGEEFGMTNFEFDNINQFKDIETKNYYQILLKDGLNKKQIFKILNARSRDQARLPIQWNNKKNAGFSKIKHNIIINSNYSSINFKSDYNSKKSIFKSYQKLIKLRKNNPILIEGKINFFKIHKNIMSFYRVYKSNKIIVIINLSNKNIEYKNCFFIKKSTILFSNYKTNNNLNIILAYQVIVAKI